MIRATVHNYLNVRTGKPEIHPHNNPGDKYYIPGDVVEIETALIGDDYKRINIWYRLNSGAFIWSGGITKTEALKSLTEKIFPSWMVQLNIPEIWEYSKGENVGVAVIDTGINMNNPDLSFNKHDFFVYEHAQSLQDQVGHGTHCASLIGAKNRQGRIMGVAPEANLYICKIADQGSLSENEATRYADAINWCIGKNYIQIISISWGGRITDPSILQIIEDAVSKAVADNKVVLCAIGDASRNGDSSKRFPACCRDAIGIGSVTVQGKLYSYFNQHLVTTVDGYNIESYAHNTASLIAMSGTSQSNAIVAGIVALIIKKQNFRYAPAQIKSLLDNLSETVSMLNLNAKQISGEKLLNYFKN